MSKATAERLRELQASVKDADYEEPSQRVLVSCLILWIEKRGEDLEQNVLRPFRNRT
jgi:hypothetical protein